MPVLGYDRYFHTDDQGAYRPAGERLMSGGVRSPEAAERLGARGRDAYKMLFDGELDGGPGRDGMVYFDEASIDAYLDRHASAGDRRHVSAKATKPTC